MAERLGVGLAVAAGGLVGMAAAVTGDLIGGADPFTLAALRFGIGCSCLLPVALLMRRAGPRHRDRPVIAGPRTAATPLLDPADLSPHLQRDLGLRDVGAASRPAPVGGRRPADIACLTGTPG